MVNEELIRVVPFPKLDRDLSTVFIGKVPVVTLFTHAALELAEKMKAELRREFITHALGVSAAQRKARK